MVRPVLLAPVGAGAGLLKRVLLIISPLGEFVKWRNTYFFAMPKKPELSPEDQALREQLGSSIRSASVRHSKKPQDVAAAGGISLAHQYRIESGERTPDGLYLIKVSAYLGISLDELCGLHAQASSPKREAPSQHATSGGINQINHGHGAVQIGAYGGKVNIKKRG